MGIVQGFTFGLLFFFIQRKKKYANRFLGSILLIFALYLSWVVVIDTRAAFILPGLLYFPYSLILAFGPSIYFYTKATINHQFRLAPKDWLHYSPIILDLVFQFLCMREGMITNELPCNTATFVNISPIIQLLGIISITIYCYLAIQRINQYEAFAKNQYSNIDQYSLQWLKKLWIGYAIIWLLWVPYTLVDFFFFDWQLSIAAYYPIYIFLFLFTFWIAIEAFRRPEIILNPAVLQTTPKEKPKHDINLLRRAANEIHQQVVQKRILP